MNLNLPVNVTSTSQEYLQDIDGQSPGLLQNDGAAVCIYFDVSDFIYFIGHHSNLTGIQRVQAQIISSLQALDKVTYNFCSYSHQHRAFVGVDRDLLMSVISELSKRQEARRNLFDASLARIGMLTNTVDSVLPMRPSTRDKNVICLLGAAWVIEDYAFKINDLRRLCNARFVCLFHDLIPIFAKDTCDKGTAVVFERFLRQIVPYIDGVMFVSEHTKRDFQYYIETSGLAFNKTMTVLKNGSFLDESNKVEFTVDDALKSDYILLVSTIEGRKNHILAFRAHWKRYLSDAANVRGSSASVASDGVPSNSWRRVTSPTSSAPASRYDKIYQTTSWIGSIKDAGSRFIPAHTRDGACRSANPCPSAASS